MSEMCVFIGGLDRSGKTYMRFALTANPDFVISKRTNLWTRYYKKFGSLANDRHLTACLTDLAKNKHILALQPDFELVRKEFKMGPPTYARLFEIIHQQAGRESKKKYWGDQTELIEKYAPDILEAYPFAKFIQMIRDPRDRYEAILNKSNKPQYLGVATARWLYSAALAKKNQTKFPGRYLVIRYEDLVSQPEQTIRAVCEFLGVEYDLAMVKMEHVARFSEYESEEVQRSGPLSTKYIGRFQQSLNPGQIAFIQSFSKPLMNWFGYPLVSIQVPWQEKLKTLLALWPANLFYMFGWHTLNLVRRGK